MQCARVGGGGLEMFVDCVSGCCLGAAGAVACQCDPMERAVRGLSGRRGERRLTPAERAALELEASRFGIDVCCVGSGMSDRDVAVAVEACWDAKAEA
jgi:hypothetical protein